MKVFVFGAGASKGYGLPLNKEFLPKACRKTLFGPVMHSFKGSEVDLILETLDRLYGTKLVQVRRGEVEIEAGTLWIKPSPESIYAVEKINIEDLVLYAARRRRLDLQKALHSVIFRTLTDDFRYHRDNGEYEAIVHRLLESSDRACLISFNYDLALDKALQRQTKELAWSYGMEFSAGIENYPTYEAMIKRAPQPQVYYLKLHGSLNWDRCTKCGNPHLVWYERFQHRRRFPCDVCGAWELFEPVLVAPSMEKHFPAAFDGLWKLAAQYLEQATALTTVGYSFPTVDREARHLFLKHFIIKNLYQPTCRKLTIVEPDQSLRRGLGRWLGPLRDETGDPIEVSEFETFQDFNSPNLKPS